MSTALPLSRFRVDAEKCTGCGLCAGDCPAEILEMAGGVPAMKPENDGECLACQHCLAICPAAAVSVAGRNSADSRPVETLDAAAVDRVVFARRSVRKFAPEPVAAETIRELIDIAAHAPTAVNARDLHFTVVSGHDAMRELRRRGCERLVALRNTLPEERRWIADAAQVWLNGGPDGIFRDAPHAVVVSGGSGQVHTKVDSVIALSYFEFCAVARGIGTVWCGMFDTMLRSVPESRTWLGIPGDREIGYTMLFGNPGIRYARSAQYGPASLHMVDRIQ